MADRFRAVFSSTDGRKPVYGFSRATWRLDDAVEAIIRRETGDPSRELKPYRVHDFRVTCETRLANLVISQEVRDAVLGHATPGLQRTYNKHDYLDEKRQALAAYADHVLGLVSDRRDECPADLTALLLAWKFVHECLTDFKPGRAQVLMTLLGHSLRCTQLQDRAGSGSSLRGPKIRDRILQSGRHGAERLAQSERSICVAFRPEIVRPLGKV